MRPVMENKHSTGTDPVTCQEIDQQVAATLSSKPTSPRFFRRLSHTTIIGRLTAKPEILRPVDSLTESRPAWPAKSAA